MSSEIPSDRQYTAEHEWIVEDGEIVRVGITDFAQEQLGDVVYVDLPAAGSEVARGQAFGEVESTKSVSDLFAPISGIIRERNEELEDRPELVNDEPYGAGWMVTIEPQDAAELGDLLDAEAYAAHAGG